MIRLFTDSAANLPQNLIEKLGVTVIPFTCVAGERKLSGFTKDFGAKEYYALLKSGVVAKTSMINPYVFTENFENALKNGYDVLYVGMSSGISGTFAAARSAAEELKNKYPDRAIEVVDTRAASLGEGMLVIKAAEYVSKGESCKIVAALVRESASTMNQIFTVDDLKYLRKSGRVCTLAAIIGGILDIRPVLIGNAEGKIVVKTKTRGAKKAIKALADEYELKVKDKTLPVGIAHADNEAGVNSLIAALKERGFTGELTIAEYEPITGAHVGPGTVALFFFGQKRA